MLIVELTYKKSLTEANKYLEEHKAFLQHCYEQGFFLASGPKDPRDGGIIIAQLDKNAMLTIIKEDPFFQHDIADFKLTEFTPTKYSKEFEKLLG